MHVVIVSEYSRPWAGGISEHVFHEAEGLFARGHRVSVVSGPDSAQAGFSPGITTHALRFAADLRSNASRGRLSFDARLLGRWLDRLAPDVVHVHAPFDPILPLAAVLASPVAVVGTFHASFAASPLWSSLYYRRLPWIASASRKLRARIAVSPEARRSATQYWPGDYTLIPNGVDLARFAAPAATQRRGVIYLGRPDARKGLPLLIAAIAALAETELTVVGPIDAATQTLLLRGVDGATRRRIHFTGYLSPERLAQALHRASMLCAPSLGNESQGIVLLEAMAASLPVVASNIAGYRDVITHEKTGLLVAPGSVTDLVSALSRLEVDSALRTRLADAGLRAVGPFAWNGVIRRIEEVLGASVGAEAEAHLARAQ